jgi:hypothetical protein
MSHMSNATPIASAPPSKAYDEFYDRVFGKKKEKESTVKDVKKEEKQ